MPNCFYGRRLLRKKYLHQKLYTKELLHQIAFTQKAFTPEPFYITGTSQQRVFTPPEGDADQRDPGLPNTKRRRRPALPCVPQRIPKYYYTALHTTSYHSALQRTTNYYTRYYRTTTYCKEKRLQRTTRYDKGLQRSILSYKVQHLKLLTAPVSQVKTVEK